MNLSASRRTWEEAVVARRRPPGPKVRAGLARFGARRKAARISTIFLGQAGSAERRTGRRLALLRADMALRWETGEKVGAQWYLDRYSDLGEDTIVALVYEEFCLREEDDEHPEPAEYLARYPAGRRAARAGAARSTSWSARARRRRSCPISTGDGATARGRAFPGGRPDDRRLPPGRGAGPRGVRPGLPGAGSGSSPTGRSP